MPLPTVTQLQHPEYIIGTQQWMQWRLTYVGGHDFKVAYLRKYSTRENNDDFMFRKEMAYVPAFAKAAINEIKNSIYERLDAVHRIGGSKAYQDAVAGKDGGVDYLHNSMKSFMGVKVLPELMTMSKVGVYVDMPQLKGPSLLDNMGIRPYLYIYRIEDIMNWVYDVRMEFQSLLLREYVYEYDEDTGFPIQMVTRFRHLWVDLEGKIWLQFFALGGQELSEPMLLEGLKQIPFYCLQLSQSLMSDISDYQIALLQLSSSDLMYAMKSNYPFYIEQFDPIAESSSLMKSENNLGATGTEGLTDTQAPAEVAVGSGTGRRYPINTDAPAFIHPSPEPLKASMEKQDKMKEEIRLLLNLSIQNLTPTRSSAEAKIQEGKPLENGLAYIGLELELAERQIASIWAQYEGGRSLPAEVHYPTSYTLKTDEQRRQEAKDYNALVPTIPSRTFQREIGKQVANILLCHKVDQATLEKIHKEIDAAPNMVVDPKMVVADVEAGLVDKETASKARCWPDGVVEKANEEFVERANKIAEAQSKNAVPHQGAGAGARGVPDLSATPSKDSKDEKKGKPVRGEGKDADNQSNGE